MKIVLKINQFHLTTEEFRKLDGDSYLMDSHSLVAEIDFLTMFL